MYRKKPPALNNLPLHLAKRIVKHVDPMSRKSLRQACISMKTAVDTTPVTYEKLSLTLADKAHAIYIELIIDKENRMEVEFEVMPNGYKVRNPQKNWEKKVRVARKSSEDEPPPFIEAAMTHFMRVVRRWTFHVKALVLDFESPESTYLRIQEHQENFRTLLFTKLFRKHQSLCLQLMREKLEVLGIPVSVESFRMEFFGCQDDILSVLPFLSPGILKKIRFINSGEEYEVLETDRLVELRQWREAKELCSTYRLEIEPEQWTHFEKVYTAVVYQRDDVQSNRMIEICRSQSHWTQFILKGIAFSLYDLEKNDPLITRGLERRDHYIISVPDLGFHIDAFESGSDLFLYRRSHEVVPDRKEFEANLTGMPRDVLKKIIEPLDALSRQSLRLTCKSLKIIADSVPVTYRSLLVQLEDKKLTITLFLDENNHVQLIFEPGPLGYTIRNPLHNWELTVLKRRRYDVDERGFIKAGAKHLLKLFATKPVLKKLIISVEIPGMIHLYIPFFDALALIPAPWRVQELQVTDSEAHIISTSVVSSGIFAKLEPRTLKTIRLLGWTVREWAFIQIMESEQWRHVEKLVCTCSVPIEIWRDFKFYQVHLKSITKTVAARFFQTLIESAITKEVTVMLQEKLRDSVLTYFKQFEDFKPLDSKSDNSTQLIKVPGTDNQFVSVQLLDFKVCMMKVAL